VKINESRFRYVMGSHAGPVGRRLGQIGARAESAAKVIATSEQLVRSGRFRASIAWRRGRDANGQFVEVGSAVPHARLLERGTEPHLILPRTKRALWWTHGAERGWLVPVRPLRYVRHPGTRPYQVIRRAIAFAARGGIA
jgi:hypothetical protein